MNFNQLSSYYKSKEFQVQDEFNSKNILQKIIANNASHLDKVEEYKFNGSFHYSNPHNYISTEVYNEGILKNQEKYRRYAKRQDDEYLKQFTRYSPYILIGDENNIIDNREEHQQFINRNYDTNNPALTQGHSIIASTKVFFNDEINDADEISRETVYYTNPSPN